MGSTYGISLKLISFVSFSANWPKRYKIIMINNETFNTDTTTHRDSVITDKNMVCSSFEIWAKTYLESNFGRGSKGLTIVFVQMDFQE